MELVKKFAESLKDILYDYQLSVEELSKAIGISKNSIYVWQAGYENYLPSISNLLILADYFNCSVDYLIGIEETNYLPKLKPYPIFANWFRQAVELKGYNLYRLQTETKINTGNFYKWINGKGDPSLDSLVRIAKVLDCSIDYLLGRGD
ncbi:MAG: helix-turn-helix domain-containing protein [Firmicutes bacterium]|nr:helix-turn-helix domain-containing protein [Bacillota bacterium]